MYLSNALPLFYRGFQWFYSFFGFLEPFCPKATLAFPRFGRFLVSLSLYLLQKELLQCHHRKPRHDPHLACDNCYITAGHELCDLEISCLHCRDLDRDKKRANFAALRKRDRSDQTKSTPEKNASAYLSALRLPASQIGLLLLPRIDARLGRSNSGHCQGSAKGPRFFIPHRDARN